MEFKTTAGALARAVNQVAWVIEHRNTIPILANVSIRADDRFVDVSGTNMDVQAQCWASDCHVMAHGATSVGAHALRAVLKTLDADMDVRVLASEPHNKLVLTGENLDVSMPTLPVHDVPVMRVTGKREARAVLSLDELRELYDRVSHAISTEATRYYLNGVCFETRGDELRFIATDGHRLSIAALNISERAGRGREGKFPCAIFPREALCGIRKLINGKQQGEIEIDYHDDLKFVVRFNHTSIISKAIDGTFPAYDRVTPTTFTHFVTVPRARLVTAIKRASAIADTGKAVALEAGKGELSVRCRDIEGGEVRERMPASVTGGPTEIGFNSSYLLAALDRLRGADVRLEINDEKSPGKLVDVGHESNIVLLMPMRF